MLNYGKFVRCVSSTSGLLKIKLNIRQSLVSSSNVTKISPSMMKQARVLTKLMTNKRKQWPAYNSDHDKVGASFNEEMRKNKGNKKRKDAFNSILLRYISDLLSSGEISNEFAGKGIEITGVKVTEDLSRANVYWFCAKEVNSSEVGVLLNNHSGFLRSQLSNLHLLGEIPFLVFVKDSYQDRVLDVERLLAQADFGPDYDPKYPQFDLKPDNQLQSSALDDNCTNVQIMGEGSSSKLKTNIYNLDRSLMLIKVKEASRRLKSPAQIVNDPKRQSRNFGDMQLSSKETLQRMVDFIKKQKRTKMMLQDRPPVLPIDFLNLEKYQSENISETDELENEVEDIEFEFDDEQYDK